MDDGYDTPTCVCVGLTGVAGELIVVVSLVLRGVVTAGLKRRAVVERRVSGMFSRTIGRQRRLDPFYVDLGPSNDRACTGRLCPSLLGIEH